MKIEINKLGLGLHQLEYTETATELGIKDQAIFPESIYSSVAVDKSESHIYIKAEVTSTAHFVCDRCLKEFNHNLNGGLSVYYEIVTPGSHAHLVDKDAEDDSVRIYRQDMKEIDLTDDIRDTIILAVPMKLLCSPECKGICAGCGNDLNVEACSCSEKPIDPRWASLQELLDHSPPKN